MKFGLFDHVDRSDDRPLAQQFDERLELVAIADAAGFFDQLKSDGMVGNADAHSGKARGDDVRNHGLLGKHHG